MGKPSVEIFVLYPRGKISEFQRRQMSTVQAENVHVLSVEGTSDDLDLMLKDIAAERKFCEDYKVSYINSFNWGRIMIQAAHFFFAYFRVDPELRGKVSFSIPTGAMGNLVAGYLAYLMGLPVDRLIVATNSNDILNRYFQHGDFSKRGAVVQTVSPSMDIQAPYNFERFLYFITRDPKLVFGLYAAYDKTGEIKVEEGVLAESRRVVLSTSVSEKETLETIRSFQATHRYLLDPHTAVGVAASVSFQASSVVKTPVICLATAHPCKFEDAVREATGEAPTFPASASGLLEKPEVHLEVPAGGDVTKLLKEMVVESFTRRQGAK